MYDGAVVPDGVQEPGGTPYKSGRGLNSALCPFLGYGNSLPRLVLIFSKHYFRKVKVSAFPSKSFPLRLLGVQLSQESTLVTFVKSVG